MTSGAVSIAATVVSLVLLLVVLELVRRRRLREKYALLWILTAIVLLILSVWRGLVDSIAVSLGISYGPIVTVAIGAIFILVVLLHYSTVISALTDRSVVLAQRVAMLEQRIGALEEAAASSDQEGSAVRSPDSSNSG